MNLSRRKIKPMGRRKLGQHFLVDRHALEALVEAADISIHDVVVEIGAGRGNLTQILAERGGTVYAVELDERLFRDLTKRVKGLSNVRAIHGDILKLDFGEMGDKVKVVGNIPYYISTPIIKKLLENRGRISLMVLTVQKEVARRLTAGPGGKEYGTLSLWIQYYARVKMVASVPAKAFRPPPEVDSAIIRAEMREGPPVAVSDERLFFNLIRAAFSQRRKTLINNLKGAPQLSLAVEEWREILESLAIDPGTRGEALGMGEYAELANAASARISGG